jgi:hypothetical protein
MVQVDVVLGNPGAVEHVDLVVEVWSAGRDAGVGEQHGVENTGSLTAWRRSFSTAGSRY